MTDEEVVKTLAEFMGIDAHVIFCAGPWRYIPRESHVDLALPQWLTSYDAIADVWRKVKTAPNLLYGKAADELVPNHCFCDWFTATPRQHAEALATAVREAKG